MQAPFEDIIPIRGQVPRRQNKPQLLTHAVGGSIGSETSAGSIMNAEKNILAVGYAEVSSASRTTALAAELAVAFCKANGRLDNHNVQGQLRKTQGRDFRSCLKIFSCPPKKRKQKTKERCLAIPH